MSKNIVLIMGGDGKIAQAVVKKYLSLEDTIVIAVDKNEVNRDATFNQNENYIYYSCNLTDLDELSSLYEKIEEKYGYVSHIISMAGGPAPSEEKGLFEMTYDDVEKSIKLNITSHIYITKMYLPLLQKCVSENKSILFFSSVNALKSFNLPAYSAGKAGIIGFMNSIVRDIGKEKIRVNTISPGTVATKEEVALKEGFWGYNYRDMMALKTFTYPEDIANVCYSVTHIATAITGHNIVVDSGQIV